MSFLDLITNRRGLFIWSAAIIIAVAFLVFSNQGVLRRLNIQTENQEITEKISRQKEIKDSLQHRIHLLKTDLNEIERIARESYGMIKPGEKVYFIKKNANDEKEE